MNEIQIHEVSRRYVDCPYVLGDKTKGFDCLTMVYDFYESLGAKLPREWNGWTLDNYAERWRQGGGRKELVEFMMTLGTPVQNNFMQRGDLIVFGDKLGGPAIYLGNQLAVRIFEDGGRVHSIHPIEKYIKSVRRLI